jgi:hypothetical protein
MKPKKESERSTTYARGGKDRMFKERAAGPAKPANTGKAQTAAPGAKRAIGGPKNQGYGLSLPVQPDRTAPARLGKVR